MKEDYVVFIAHTEIWRQVVGFISRPKPWEHSGEGLYWGGAIYKDAVLHMLGGETYGEIEAQALANYPGYRVVRDGLCIRDASPEAVIDV